MATPHLNGKHVVFGEGDAARVVSLLWLVDPERCGKTKPNFSCRVAVVEGMDVVREVERSPVSGSKPDPPIFIVGCGEIKAQATTSSVSDEAK